MAASNCFEYLASAYRIQPQIVTVHLLPAYYALQPLSVQVSSRPFSQKPTSVFLPMLQSVILPLYHLGEALAVAPE